MQGPTHPAFSAISCHIWRVSGNRGQALQVKEVPGWVTNLAAAGATIMAEEHAPRRPFRAGEAEAQSGHFSRRKEIAESIPF